MWTWHNNSQPLTVNLLLVSLKLLSAPEHQCGRTHTLNFIHWWMCSLAQRSVVTLVQFFKFKALYKLAVWMPLNATPKSSLSTVTAAFSDRCFTMSYTPISSASSSASLRPSDSVSAANPAQVSLSLEQHIARAISAGHFENSADILKVHPGLLLSSFNSN